MTFMETEYVPSSAGLDELSVSVFSRGPERVRNE